jgi:hypothetical protein
MDLMLETAKRALSVMAMAVLVSPCAQGLAGVGGFGNGLTGECCVQPSGESALIEEMQQEQLQNRLMIQQQQLNSESYTLPQFRLSP